MFTKEIIVSNETGLHARPASQLVQLAKKFDSKITIVLPNKTIDCKSIVSLLSGGICKGTEITLNVEGSDEETAGAEIANYIETLTD